MWLLVSTYRYVQVKKKKGHRVVQSKYQILTGCQVTGLLVKMFVLLLLHKRDLRASN